METIKDIEALRKIVGEPRPLTPFKIQKRLNVQAQNFIAHSPLLMLATADADGKVTVSPKGDLPGFVFVKDEQTLYLPERKGNKLIFSLQNILHNPSVGLLFIVPGTSETLRVQGVAELTADAELCQSLSLRGREALLVTVVKVTECYFHCAKSFLRGSIWQPQNWSEQVKVSFGEEIACNFKLDKDAIEKFDAGVSEGYKTTL